MTGLGARPGANGWASGDGGHRCGVGGDRCSHLPRSWPADRWRGAPRSDPVTRSGPTRGVPRNPSRTISATKVAAPGRTPTGQDAFWRTRTRHVQTSAAPVRERQSEDSCLSAPVLLPSSQSDDGVRPVPSSFLLWVCVDAPARLSLWFAHASGRPVPLTQDVRHARNSGEFWKDHNLGRLAHRVEVPNEEHQRCLCERAHLVREDS